MEEQYELPFAFLAEPEYQKALGQLRLQLNGILGIFDIYGLGVYILGAIDEVIKVCEQFGMRVRGDDRPIDIEIVRREKQYKGVMRTAWQKA